MGKVLEGKNSKRIAWFVTVIMVLMCFVPSTGFAGEKILTRGEAAKTIVEAAQDYNNGVTEEQVMQGYENGDQKSEMPISRVEAYIMISKAFGAMPEPKGNNLCTGVFDVKFKDVPKWASLQLKNLEKAGLLTENGKEVLGARENITAEDLTELLARVYAYMGTNPKDDFYSTINKKWLDSAEIPSGYPNKTAFNELGQANDEHIQEIITEMQNSNAPEGSSQRKVVDFYNTAIDKKTRDEQGIKPIQKYITLIDDAKNMDELVAVDALMDNEIGICFLIPWGVAQDAKDNTKNILQYYGASLGLDKESYNNEKTVKAFKNKVESYLILTGETREMAQKHANDIYNMEKMLSTYELDMQEMNDAKKVYNIYTKEDFVKLFTGFDMNKALEEMGVGEVETLNVYKHELTKKAAELMTDSNLDTWKTSLKYLLLSVNSKILSTEVEEVEFQFGTVYQGINGKLSPEKQALELTMAYASTPIEQAYAKKYFSANAKKDIENMVAEFIQVYEERIKKNDWLSPATKAMAIKKLDKMTVKIGYPDVWPVVLDNVDIVSSKEGGNLFANVAAIVTYKNEISKNDIGKPENKDKWGLTVNTVNAYYNFLENEIVFPAGILQAPLYDEKASREANLGGIGMVIAHEITHAFDNIGAAYDENGNANNWWTEKDFANFEKRCKQVEELYDGKEIAPGMESDGKITISENVSDIGGISCALAVAEKGKDPNYDDFFTSFAKVLKTVGTRETLSYYLQADVHSNGRLRINQTLKNFDKFYETYNISSEDGMYLPVEERISIW